MENEEFDYSAAAATLQEDRPVWKLVFASIKQELCPNRKNWFGFAFSVVIGGAVAVIIGTADNTVTLSIKVSEIFLDIQVAIFGCVFGVYSILLAFLSDSYIKKLLKVEYKDRKNYLKASTEYYGAALFIYFVAIIISLVLNIFLNCMPVDFIMPWSHFTNELVASFLLMIYLTYSIRVIYELKSVIGNTLLLFRTSLIYKIQSFTDEKNESATQLTK